MCTKEIAARSRNAAYILLVEIGEAMIKWSDTRDGNTDSTDKTMQNVTHQSYHKMHFC